jgi:hypothetical protein
MQAARGGGGAKREALASPQARCRARFAQPPYALSSLLDTGKRGHGVPTRPTPPPAGLGPGDSRHQSVMERPAAHALGWRPSFRSPPQSQRGYGTPPHRSEASGVAVAPKCLNFTRKRVKIFHVLSRLPGRHGAQKRGKVPAFGAVRYRRHRICEPLVWRGSFRSALTECSADKCDGTREQEISPVRPGM